jgi:WS/DGAT/MGAT family acyltransferase
MSKAERMSSVDTTWLRMDRPANPMVIVGVLILEGPLDLNKLESTIAERFLAVPRFRQHVESRAGECWWVDDPYFDATRHIKRVRLPGKGDQSELQRYIAQLASDQLDKSRPLWQLHIVEDYEGGAALVARFHHAIADGMALVGLMLSVTDGGDRRIWTANAKAEASAWLSLPGLKRLQKGIGFTAGLLKEAKALAANPVDTAKIGAGVAGELAYLLLMPEDSWTRFKGKPSGNKRVAWTDPIPLLEVKAVSKALGCTINDILLASVAGALCDYLREKGDPTKGVEIRALVPVDMRRSTEAGQLGNKFGIAAVELPVGIENPLARVLEVHRRMHALKQSLEPPVTLGMFAALGYAPQVLQDRLFNLLMHRATAVMTNVPGPQSPLFIGGAEIKQIMFWVPQSGDIGMGVSILSFNGMVQFGLITDAAMVPDPEAIIAHFRPQFEQLLYFVLMSHWGAEDMEATERIGAIAPAARTRTARAASQKHEEAGRIEAAVPAAPARKRRAAPKQQDAELKEAPIAATPVRKTRAASQPRTRGTRTDPPAAPKPKSAPRRKLPRT